MPRPEPKGWCPGAHRPMQSGDGLIVRVRPRLARITPVQVRTLADLSLDLGNGLIDLTNRANLQLRGIKPADLDPLLLRLAEADLLDIDAEVERRRSVLCAPDWVEGDDTQALARELNHRLAELPVLPAKFSFVIDSGPELALAGETADLRIERALSGGLILRAGLSALGAPITAEDAVSKLIALAHWHVATGDGGRIAQCSTLPGVPNWAAPTELPAHSQARLRPGQVGLGHCVGFAFGRIAAQSLLKLPAVALRITPWRMVVLEGASQAPDVAGAIFDADDPLLAVDACPGAPDCAAASVQTRALAASIYVPVGTSLHVSGCAKGCARARPAKVTLVGRDGRFDIVTNGCAWDKPVLHGLLPEDLSGALNALCL